MNIANSKVRIIMSLFVMAHCLFITAQNKYTETDEFYKRGDLFKVIENESILIIASLEEVSQYGNYYKINLVIENKSQDEFDFMPSDVNAEYVYRKKVDKIVRVPTVSYEKYAKKVKGRIAVASAISGLAASLQAISTTPTQNISYSDNSGYRGNIRVYDQIAKNEETSRNFERISRYESLERAFIESEKDAYLLRETMFPKSSLIGYTLVKYKECHEFNVEIALNGDVYAFNWKLIDPQKEKEDKLKDDIYR